MTVVRKLAKNAFYVFSSQIANKILGVVFIVYAARLLGAEAYGIFTLVSTMVLIAVNFTNFGITPMVIRRISKDNAIAEPLLSNMLAIRLVFALIAYALLVLVVNLHGYSPEIKVLVYIAGIAILSENLILSFETVYIAYERMKIWGAMTISSSLAFSILGIAVLAAGFWLTAVFLVKVIVGAGIAIFSAYFMWKKFFAFRPRFDPDLGKEILIQSFPFFLVLILGILINKIDIIMLSMIKGPVDENLAIGYYSPAHNILFTLMILPKSIHMALLPVVSRKIYLDHDFVRKAVEKATKFIMVGVSFPIILVTTFFSKEIITVVFGQRFLPAASALAILGWAYAFQALAISSQSVLGSSKELKEYLPLLFGLFVLNVLLNLVLIPKYSYVGASIATSITFFLSFVGRFYFLRKILQVTASEIMDYLKLGVLLAGILGFAYLIQGHVEWYVLALVITLSYLASLYLFRVFNKEEVAFVTSWLRAKGWVSP